MSYHVKIIRCQSPGPESEAGFPGVVWPEAFATIDAAVDHAEESIRKASVTPGSYTYDVVNERDESVLHLLDRKS